MTVTTQKLERPALDGFVIQGQYFPLHSSRICKVYDRKTGKELEQVFYINCETGEYGFYSKGPDGGCPSLNEEGDGVLKEWAFGELRIVFDEDPPAPLLREMTIPVRHRH